MPPLCWGADSRESKKLTKFTDLGLSEAILRAVSDAGYENPTPIQKAAIPALMDGRDIVGIAQTGTGKTAAFVLPLLHKILNSHSRPLPNTCDMLVLAPTRELAAQIHENIRLYGKYMSVSSTIIVGGVKPGKQVKALSRGVNMLVATPGRLEDLQSTGAISLIDTKVVVLDEADQMLDMGFIPAIRRIMKTLPRKRQTVLFSATMPKQIRSLAQDFLRSPAEISVAPASKPIDRIEQKILHVAKPEKRQVLVDILKKETIDRAIVFTRTKHGANKVAQHLAKHGLSADAIHGNKSQGQRQRTLAGFKSGEINMLVATDIAARGIDIDGVSHVINFDLPHVPEVYVHRIGRTARAGASGIAISLCDVEERGLLRDIEKLIGRTFDSKPEINKNDETRHTADKPSLTATQRRNQRRKARKRNDDRSGASPRNGRSEKKPQTDKSGKPGQQNRWPKNNKRPASGDKWTGQGRTHQNRNSANARRSA